MKNNDMGVNCPSCGVGITTAGNAGGYGAYCEGCCISGDGYTLFVDDCLNVMGNMENDSIDLTVTSPPYDNLRDYGKDFDADSFDWHPIIKELYRVTAVGGVVVWVVADATIDGSETGTSFKQALWAMECGFRLHDTMIYHTGSQGAKGSNLAYWQAWEYMFVLAKDKPKSINRIKDHINIYAGTKNTSTRRKANGSRQNERFTTPELSVRSNVWYYATGKGVSSKDDLSFEHPAAFPEALANDHIISWSNPGDLVFDPFLGSGTTGKMAVKNGRKFIGCDIEASYVRIMNQAGNYITTDKEKQNGQVALWDMLP